MRRIEINPDVSISTEKKEHPGIALKALSIATLASLAIISTATPANAEGDNRIIIDTIDQTVTGDYSNRINNNDWHADDWSSGWYNEWNIEGGVVKNTSQNLTIKDATFDSNTLNVHNPDIVGDDSDPQWMSANGGIIGNTAGSSIKSIDNVTFSNNKTNATYTNQLVKGGVIGNFGTIESITNTKFTGNTSSAYYGSNFGGAIFNADTGVIDKIYKSKFIGNKSGRGGAIYNDGTITTISESEIGNNEVNTYSSGSAIYNTSYIGTIDNTNIHDNTGSESILNRGTIDLISNSKINGNAGNGLTNMKTESDNPVISNIVNSEFSNNGGYGIRSHSANIGNIDGSIFSGNTLSGVYLFSGYNYNDGSANNCKLGDISNSLFENNRKSGIYLDSAGLMGNVTNTTFIGNVGGAIYINDNNSGLSSIHSIGNFTDVIFENNQNGGMGGPLAVFLVEEANAVLREGYGADLGGGLYVENATHGGQGLV